MARKPKPIVVDYEFITNAMASVSFPNLNDTNKDRAKTYSRRKKKLKKKLRSLQMKRNLRRPPRLFQKRNPKYRQKR